ncbi:MAG: DUF1569 domain-containing protein [Planctomycetota bacterium]|nr:DUF1569 domain-containing protein [Planctomycetota bacterium]
MPHRVLNFSSFQQIREELDRLCSRGYEQHGDWDLSQTCDHLAYFIEGSLDGHRFKTPWLIKTLFGRFVLRRILSQGRMPDRVPSPQKPPPAPGDETAAVKRLRTVLDRFEHHTGEFHDSPFFGHLTPDEWRQLHSIHCAHHLGWLSPR